MGISLYKRYPKGVGDVARAVDLTPSHVGRILNGSRNPSLDAAQRLSRYFGMSLDRFHEELKSIQERRCA